MVGFLCLRGQASGSSTGGAYLSCLTRAGWPPPPSCWSSLSSVCAGIMSCRSPHPSLSRHLLLGSTCRWSEILQASLPWIQLMYKPPVPQRQPSASVHLDHDLLLWPHLHYDSRLVPLGWISSRLVLNGRWCSHGQTLEAPCVPRRLLTINLP